MARDGRRTTLPAPWRRIDSGTGKLHATYAHPSGYVIKHCGHPTALWPYGLYDRQGRVILAPNGYAWQKLEYAANEVARLIGQPHHHAHCTWHRGQWTCARACRIRVMERAS